ncbi:hypothetical protein VNO77_34157 [Canavalia gladiata]|uniref:Uncharacterized protein n=1 Tax=Canavalia gladiata TaxID=3824 RepID=A0AAN9KDU6_CANGL
MQQLNSVIGASCTLLSFAAPPPLEQTLGGSASHSTRRSSRDRPPPTTRNLPPAVFVRAYMLGSSSQTYLTSIGSYAPPVRPLLVSLPALHSVPKQSIGWLNEVLFYRGSLLANRDAKTPTDSLVVHRFIPSFSQSVTISMVTSRLGASDLVASRRRTNLDDARITGSGGCPLCMELVLAWFTGKSVGRGGESPNAFQVLDIEIAKTFLNTLGNLGSPNVVPILIVISVGQQVMVQNTLIYLGNYKVIRPTKPWDFVGE